MVAKSHQVDNYYQYDNGYGTSKAPQEFVIDGDPTEVWVPITLWVQAHCQTCDEERERQSDLTAKASPVCFRSKQRRRQED